MNDTAGPKKSALSRTVIEDGKSLRIEIQSDGRGGWLLELTDEHQNSTHWEDPFATEQAALDEGLAAIREEGMEAFIGPAGGYGL